MKTEPTRQKTLLVVDDLETNIDAAVAILDDYDVIAALSGSEALEILDRESVDLILLDIMMPAMSGFEVCEQVRRKPGFEHVPVIFLTAREDEDSIERAYDAGASDYVTKPFRARELQARVRFQLRFSDMFGRVAYLASHDPLTGAYNRRRFFELAREQFDDAGRRGAPCHAMMIDVDHFKQINDAHGHAVGDAMLKRIVEAITACLPEGAIVGRVGGEEFAILLTDLSSEAVVELAERLRRRVGDMRFPRDGQEPVACTVSTGVARCTSDTPHLDKLLQEADAALYDAKHLGRNRSIFRETRL